MPYSWEDKIILSLVIYVLEIGNGMIEIKSKTPKKTLNFWEF